MIVALKFTLLVAIAIACDVVFAGRSASVRYVPPKAPTYSFQPTFGVKPKAATYRVKTSSPGYRSPCNQDEDCLSIYYCDTEGIILPTTDAY